MSMLNRVLHYSTATMIAASAATASPQLQIGDSRLAIDENQTFITTLLPNPVDPSAPGVPFARGIRDFERILINDAGDVFAAIQLEKNEQINGGRPDIWAFSGASVVDGIVDPFLMSSDAPEEQIPGTYSPLPSGPTISYTQSTLAQPTADGFLVRSQIRQIGSYTDKGKPIYNNGERVELISGFDGGPMQGSLIYDTFFDGVTRSTTLNGPNVDAGSTDIDPALSHRAVTFFGSKALVEGEGANDALDQSAYYFVDTTGAASTPERIVGDGDTINLVGGGSATVANIYVPRHRADTPGFAGILANASDGSGEESFYTRTASGDWFEAATTNQAVPNTPDRTIGGFNANKNFAVDHDGRVAAIVYSQSSTGTDGSSLFLVDPNLGTAEVVVTPGMSITDDTGRIVADYGSSISTGSAQFGLDGTILFNGNVVEADDDDYSTFGSALYQYNPATGDLTTPLYEGMTVAGTDLTLTGAGLSLTAVNHAMGVALAIVRADVEDSLGYMVVSFDAEGEVTPLLLPTDEITLDGTDYLVGDALRFAQGWGEYNGLTDTGYFAVGIGDVGLAVLQVVPEPTSLALLGLGGIALLGRRKRA